MLPTVTERLARELEAWAVGAIARVGDAQDAERLRALARTIEGIETPDVPDEIGYTGRAVKQVDVEATACHNRCRGRTDDGL